MNALLFGGNSANNKVWIEQVREALAPIFERCVVHTYDHWETGEEFINFEAELTKLHDEVKNLSRYVIFAKSIGTYTG
jgi:hypothetical protein